MRVPPFYLPTYAYSNCCFEWKQNIINCLNHSRLLLLLFQRLWEVARQFIVFTPVKYESMHVLLICVSKISKLTNILSKASRITPWIHSSAVKLNFSTQLTTNYSKYPQMLSKNFHWPICPPLSRLYSFVCLNMEGCFMLAALQLRRRSILRSTKSVCILKALNCIDLNVDFHQKNNKISLIWVCAFVYSILQVTFSKTFN